MPPSISSIDVSPWAKVRNDDIFERNWCAVAAYKNRYIIIGGGSGSDTYGLHSAFIFDTYTYSYTSLPDLPDEDHVTRRFGSKCVKYEFCNGAVLKGYFYLVGRDQNMYRINISMDDNEASKHNRNRDWEKIEQCNILSGQMSYVVSDKNRLFVFCGGNFSLFDPDTKECTSLSPINIWKQRMYFATAICKGKIYIIGGFVKRITAISSVEIYDIASETWSSAPDMPLPLCDSSASVLMDRWIVVTGGCTLNRKMFDKCFVFDTHTNEWCHQITRNHVDVPSGRVRHRSVSMGGSQLFFVGGNNSRGKLFSLETIERRDLAIQNWDIMNNDFCFDS